MKYRQKTKKVFDFLGEKNILPLFNRYDQTDNRNTATVDRIEKTKTFSSYLFGENRYPKNFMTYTDLLADFASFYKDTTNEDLQKSFDTLQDEGACVLKTEKLENGNVRITMGCTEEVFSRDDLGNRCQKIFRWKEITEWTTDEDNEPCENVKTEYERVY